VDKLRKDNEWLKQVLSESNALEIQQHSIVHFIVNRCTHTLLTLCSCFVPYLSLCPFLFLIFLCTCFSALAHLSLTYRCNQEIEKKEKQKQKDLKVQDQVMPVYLLPPFYIGLASVSC
jgi:hypothetical protein